MLAGLGGATPVKIVEPQPNPEIRWAYYRLQATTAESLCQEIRLTGPRDQAGKPREGVTDWHLRWNFPKDPTARLHRDSLPIESSITITIPEWVPSEPPPAPLRTRWETYLSNIMKHERQHAHHFLEELAAFRKRLRTRAASDETVTVSEVRKELKATIARIRTRDSDYDRDTNHGRTEGAALCAPLMPTPFLARRP